MGKNKKSKNPTPPNRILTISEAALELRLSTNTVRKLLHEGRLKGVRTGPYGGKWRISERAIEEFMINDPGPACSKQAIVGGDRHRNDAQSSGS